MILHAPFKISSRLLPALQVGNAWIQLEYAGNSSDGRVRYRWVIDLPDSSVHWGDDLKSGCQGGNLQDGFASLLSFLSACAESYAFRKRTGYAGENEDLFPPAVAEWAYQEHDSLDMLACDLEEAKEPLIEE